MGLLRSAPQSVIAFFVITALLYGWSSFSVAAPPGYSPVLNEILPRGVQRGTQHTLKFSGSRLNSAQEIFFYDDGITAESVTVINHTLIEVVVRVDDDCRIGEHVAQVRNEQGFSNFRSLFVGPFPAVAEVEPNNQPSTAQPLELNRTINAVLKAEDIDRYKVNLEKGQRLSVEVEAMRLGTFVDSVIELHGPKSTAAELGPLVAFSDDTVLNDQDGFFSIIAKQSGAYTVSVRDSAYRGTNKSFYRLHVGDFPRPQAVFPAGGKPGTRLQVTTVETVGQPITLEIEAPPADAFRDSVTIKDKKNISTSPVKFRAVDLKNFIVPKNSGNKNFPTAIKIDWPVAIDGRLDSHFHYFQFSARKAQTIDVHAFAKQIGSKLDPLIHVFSSKKKGLMGNDDSPAQTRPDANLRFKVPADGDYFLRITDFMNRVGPDQRYRIEIKQAEGSAVLSIKRNDRLSQRRQAISVPRGGRFAAIMSVKKNFVKSPIKLDHGALPDGVSLSSVPMKQSVEEMPVVFDADDNAPLAGALVDFQAMIHGAPESQSDRAANLDLRSRFQMPALFSLGPPNNACYHVCNVDRLAVCVTQPLPFSIDIVPLNSPVTRGGAAKVKVKIQRKTGFDKTIHLQFPYRPPGIGAIHQISVKPDQDQIEYPINANGSAPLGTWPFYVIANSNINGLAWTSSQLCQMKIVDPFVKCEVDRVIGQRLETLSVNVTLEQLIDFQGIAKATVRGLPPHTRVSDPIEFDNQTKTVTFEVMTTEKTPFGNHKSPFIEVQIPIDDGFSTANAGNFILKIQRPKKSEPSNFSAPSANVVSGATS